MSLGDTGALGIRGFNVPDSSIHERQTCNLKGPPGQLNATSGHITEMFQGQVKHIEWASGELTCGRKESNGHATSASSFQHLWVVQEGIHHTYRGLALLNICLNMCL